MIRSTHGLMLSHTALLLVMSLSLALPCQAVAQPRFAADPFQAYGEVQYYPPGQRMMVSGRGPQMGTANRGGAAAEPLTPEQQAALKSVQAYMAMKPIGRTPSAILQELGSEEKPAAENQATEEPVEANAEGEQPEEIAAMKAQQLRVKQLQGELIRGEWQAVGEHLTELPELAGPLVYGHILTLLAQGKTIRPEEIPAIAAAAPGDLTASQLAQLGSLLKGSLAHAQEPRELLEQLAAGTKGLGGEEPVARRNAARLLLAAGMLEEADKYLDAPVEPTLETPFDLLNMTSLLEFTRVQQASKTMSLDKAWQFTELAWNSPDATEAQRAEVLQRLIALLPMLPDEQAKTWIVELAESDSTRVIRLLASMLGQAETAYARNDSGTRSSVIGAAKVIGDTLSAKVETSEEGMQRALQLLATPWLNEALKTSGDSRRLISAPDDNDVRALPQEMIEKSAPGSQWLALLPTDTAALARRLKGMLDAGNGNWEKVQQEAAKLAAYDTELAQKMIDTYLGASIQANPQIHQQVEERMQQYQNYGYGPAQLAQIRQQFMQQLMNQQSSGNGEGVTLTRAKQVQSLKELRAVLDKISAAKLPAPSATALAEAFVAAHSSAEVFRLEDMQTVFGELSELPTETTVELASKMRENLAQQWRDQRVQQAAGTNRTEIELAQEVVRGYELAIELVGKALDETPDQVALHMLAGLLRFDQSEYLYGLGADLPTYVRLRDGAFAELATAAEIYARSLPKPEEELSAEVYLRWFQLALGASDLAYLTRQATADEPQIRQLAAAIRSLDRPMVDQHLTLFGEALEAELNSIPPPLKQRSLREALIVLGDHEAGDEARKLNQYYEQLLAEVDLHTEVDGSQQVGHDQAFGLLLSVRYSTPLGREAGNFASLLSKQYDQQGNQIDSKEKLEEEIREKLTESFEIIEIRFHNPTVTPHNYGRMGWRETPLAYLVLAAKDPATDTIAPLQIDVPFRDGHGTVLLPITSQKLLIDARDKSPVVRPLEALTVKQLLDTRELQDGQLRLEIIATGKGLMPPLSQLAELEEGSQVSGFQVDSIEDHGVTLLEFDMDSKVVQPVSERTWLLTLTPANAGALDVVEQFTFPELTAESAEVSYEQYSDADIIPAESVVPLSPVVAYDAQQLVVYVASSVVGALLLILLGVLFWRNSRAVEQAQVYSVPEQLTPFSLVAFLRKVAADSRVQLAPADREVLRGTIAELESRYFTSNATAEEDHELHTVLDRWRAKAQHHLEAANGQR